MTQTRSSTIGIPSPKATKESRAVWLLLLHAVFRAVLLTVLQAVFAGSFGAILHTVKDHLHWGISRAILH